MTDPSETKAKPRGRRKGYTRVGRSREEVIATKPKQTAIHGIIGRVKCLYEVIDVRLQELDWNWSRLAEAIPCSRQYMIDLTDKETIPHEIFLRVCQVLDLDPDALIQPDTHHQDAAE